MSMQERWSRARLGNAHVDGDGRRWCVVHVECDGDPRAEVLGALEAAVHAVEVTARAIVVPKRSRKKASE